MNMHYAWTENQIIEHFRLEPLEIEGGYFRRTYFSDTGSQLSCIFYLITAQSYSTLHRLMADEIFFFHVGDPVEMLLLDDKGIYEEITLGPHPNLGHRLQQVVSAGTWQGASLADDGRLALMSTVVSPAFTFDIFEKLENLEEMLDLYPKSIHPRIIKLM